MNRRTKVYIDTFVPTDDPPWVMVTTRPTWGMVERSEEVVDGLLEDAQRQLLSLSRVKEVQRLLADRSRQERAIVELESAKLKTKAVKSALKTAQATLKALEEQYEADGDLAVQVKRYNRLVVRQGRVLGLGKASAYVVSHGGDMDAAGIEIGSLTPFEWLQCLTVEDIRKIQEAALDTLAEDERQDLSTPRASDSETRRQVETPSALIEEVPGDGSPTTTSTIEACSTKPAG